VRRVPFEMQSPRKGEDFAGQARSAFALGATLLLLVAGCGNAADERDTKGSGAAGGQVSSAGGNGAGAGVPVGGSSNTGGGGAGAAGGTGGQGGGFSSATCSETTTALPALPELPGVLASVRGNGAKLRIEPLAQAKDYRVYALPADADIDSTQGLSVHDATYRCAGEREASRTNEENGGASTRASGDVAGYNRPDAEKILGHVFTSAAEGRVPVYALGDPTSGADQECYGWRWDSSRKKRYVVDESERATLLAEGWRDDGVAFYVPSQAGDTTQTVSRAQAGEFDGDAPLYFSSSAEASARDSSEAAFEVLKDAADVTVPLYRVYFTGACGGNHDELAAGEARFNRVLDQGPQPTWEVDWPEVTPGSVLVVEALDAGCPFQGHLSPVAIPATGNAQAFITLDDARDASTGELFINGQFDPANRPQPIARSFICLEPGANESMDWFEDFSDFSAELTETDRLTYGGMNLYLTGDTFDVSFFSIEQEVWALGSIGNELWATYADWASDTNGKLRLTPKQSASLSDSTFLHATMSVDAVSTGRRYPQLWVSDVGHPVQDNMVDGGVLNMQTFGGWPSVVQIQICDHRNWDVNDQCPAYALERTEFSEEPFPPHAVAAERTSVGLKVRFDFYVSTQRAYAFYDGQPYGCADLPDGFLNSGDAHVTFGDVLYHSGVDEPIVLTDDYRFHKLYQLTETTRHFDDLGFSSGVSAPAWDEARLPCAPPP
jgi:hypothetical protein